MKSTSMHRNRRDNRFVVTWRNYFRNRRVFYRSSKNSVILFNSQRTKSAIIEFLRFNLLLALADKKRSQRDLVEILNVRLKEKIIRTSEKDTFERFQKNTIDS